jgi:hypothetical protein
MPAILFPRTRVAAAALACLAVVLTGCGSADEPSAAPSHPSASATAGTADQKYTEWELKFRSCLSDKGFELPKEAGKIDFGSRQDAYEVAETACITKIGKPPTASKDEPVLSDNEKKATALKVMQCLRDQGYEVTDRPGQAPLVKVPDGVSPDGSKKCYGK